MLGRRFRKAAGVRGTRLAELLDNIGTYHLHPAKQQSVFFSVRFLEGENDNLQCSGRGCVVAEAC